MAKKKPKSTPTPNASEADQALEKHIDEMMDPRVPDTPPPAKSVSIKIIDHSDLPQEPPKPPLQEPATEAEFVPEGAPPLPGTAPSLSAKEQEVIVKAPSPKDEKQGLDEAIAEANAHFEDIVEAVPPVGEAADASEPETPVAEVDPAPKPEADDPDLEKAVNDIVAKESDELLAVEDRKLANAAVPKPPSKRSLRKFLAAYWHNPWARWATLFLLLCGVVAAGLVPQSRYALLNTAGVRSSISLAVYDDSTQQPLKNVQVKIGNQSGVTDQSGKVRLEQLRLGTNELVIEKPAFAPINKKLVLGWGSNPQPQYSLTPVGAQYTFMVSDFLSGKALAKVEASSGQASALSDSKGLIKLTIDQKDDKPIEVSIKGEGQREEKLTLGVGDKATHALKLVSARKHAFISKRSGKLDVYSIDIDGKNEKKVLPATGSERDDIVMVPHPTTDVVALVSTRDNKRNTDGFLLSSLILLDLKTGKTIDVAQSEKVQIVDWVKDRLVYVKIAAGASAAAPTRHRLTSYDYKEESSKELAASNYFNDVISVAGKIYYASSSAYQTGNGAYLYQVYPDGSSRQTLLDKEVWNMFRTGYDQLALSVQQDWYGYKLGESKAAKQNSAPTNLTSRLYIDSADGRHSLWVDSRDGKGVLLAYDRGSKEDKQLRSQSGLKNPVYWLNDNVVVYRINTDQETADYALSLNGGEPVKIRDVTNTGGVDRWYYY